jgi:hypothetical protein
MYNTNENISKNNFTSNKAITFFWGRGTFDGSFGKGKIKKNILGLIPIKAL